jgi:DNA polymerase-3 subunit delta
MASELQPVYLVGGSDRPKVERAVRRLRERLGGEATEALSAEESSAEDAVAACNALGLFTGEARLVLVESVERWKAADAKAIADYLATPAPATVLALVAGEVKADSALAKACAKAGELLVYEAPRKRDLPGWVAEQLGRLGASADPDACRALVELVGEDLRALTTEIEKLATWAGEEPIGARDVERLAVAAADVPPWTLTDAWGRRDAAAVLSALEEALERADSPRADTVARLVGSLSAHVRMVRACQRLDGEGVSADVAAKRLGKRPFPVQKAYSQARNFSVDELGEAVIRIAELERAVRGGSRLSGELELSRVLVEITRPRAGAAAI